MGQKMALELTDCNHRRLVLNKPIRHTAHLLLLLAVAGIVASCNDKDVVAPADIEAQAFVDLGVEVREAIDDASREARALSVVDTV